MLRSDKKHKTVTLCAAARTGDIKTLQRASKTALNWSDDETMTPAMWSAARGQLYALRVIVERGYVTFICSHRHIYRATKQMAASTHCIRAMRCNQESEQ